MKNIGGILRIVLPLVAKALLEFGFLNFVRISKTIHRKIWLFFMPALGSFVLLGSLNS